MKRTVCTLVASLVVILLGLPRLGWGQEELVGFIDAPANGSTRTGAFQVAGFLCLPLGLEPQDVVLSMNFDLGPSFPVSYGNDRGDTAATCGGETRNGFVAQFNYNILGTGPHTIRLFADTGTGPVEFASSTFNVLTLGQEFAMGLSTPLVTVNNWPNQGQRTQLQWQESIQNWTIVSVSDTPVTGEWLFALSLESGSPTGQCQDLASMTNLFGSVNMELDVSQGAAGPGGSPITGQLREVATAASEGVTFNVTGTVQANGDFSFSTDALENAADDGCTISLSMTGAGNFFARSVDQVELSISSQNCPEEDTVACSADYSGSISLP